MLVKTLMLMKIALCFLLTTNKYTKHSVQKIIPQSIISSVILKGLSEEVCDTDSVENNLCDAGKQGTAQPDDVNNLTKTSGCGSKTETASKTKRGERQQGE